MILDENFNEVKRIRFEASNVVSKGDPLDGHDFLFIDLDHYILSGYIHETVFNVSGYEQGRAVETVDAHSFNGKFSRACGSAQRVDGSIYVVSFGAATKDNEYMSVIDFATGEKLLSVTQDDPQNFTYRCVYFE